MEKKIITVMLAAAMCVCLAACGEEKNNVSEEPAAGGAVTKAASAAADESPAEEAAESKAEKKKADEAETPEEKDPELASAYEGSLTEAFVGKLSDHDFGIDYDKFKTDGDEGMEKTGSTSVTGNGEIVHSTQYTSADGSDYHVGDELMLYEGKLYSRNGEAEKYSFLTDYDESADDPFIMLLMGDPWNMEFVSSDSFSDGTIEEVFSSDGKTYTYVYSADGVLVSVEHEQSLMLVNNYDESADIEITEGFKDMFE